MSEPLSSLKEGYIYIDPLRLYGLWIYLGLFNYLKAKSIGNGLYRCEVIEDQPVLMKYEEGSLFMPSEVSPNEFKPIGCSLENLQKLLRWIKEFQTTHFNHRNFDFDFVVCRYIIWNTLSKSNIELPSNFEVIKSDNNSLILRAPNFTDLIL
jgi:hypothetical protein